MILHRVVGGWGHVERAAGDAIDIVALQSKCPQCAVLFPARGPGKRFAYCTESCRRQAERETENS